MPSITNWMRLEPKIKRTDATIGLQARIHDPLWLLGKQWQLGEFRAEDAGSPVQARMDAHLSRLSRYHMGSMQKGTTTGKKYDSTIPLEVLVECESIYLEQDQQYNWRLASETGLHLLRIFDLNGLKKHKHTLINKFPINVSSQESLDNESARFLLLMASRSPDGISLHKALEKLGLSGVVNKISKETSDKASLTASISEWQLWFESLYSEPDSEQPAWIRDRLEYEFSVSANTNGGECVFTAPEYDSGDLDWYAFDENIGQTLGAKNDAKVETISRSVIPAPVTYRGMPAARWWEFEDAQINFAGLETDSDDISRLVFLDYVINYSNDWFVIPFELPVGSISELQSLIVTDTFGLKTKIKPYSEIDGIDTDWQLFCFSHYQENEKETRTQSNRLFLPPVLSTSLHSKPIEEVLFLRDEMANMAWAIEKTIEGGVVSILVTLPHGQPCEVVVG